MKKSLIIRTTETKVKVHKDYLQIKSLYDEKIVGFKNIGAVYINKTVKIKLSDCLKLMAHFPVFFTDEHGTILASLQEE